ncbi:hypothetical protein ACWCQ1_14500 [Streptomyces sp. NPDC002144]|uniref:hypothetical protein n=1 Tax=Streptomyces sp. NPDC006668 TaxID=3156903 RepID=UPI0033F47335
MSVTVAEPAFAQVCLGSFPGTRGSPSVLRGNAVTPCPDSGFSDAGTFARLLASAPAVAVACSSVPTRTVETASAILRRIRLRAVAAMSVRLIVSIPCRAYHTGPARRGSPLKKETLLVLCHPLTP